MNNLLHTSLHITLSVLVGYISRGGRAGERVNTLSLGRCCLALLGRACAVCFEKDVDMSSDHF